MPGNIKAKKLLAFHTSRKEAAGITEDSFTVLITVPARKSLRAYVNKPGKKKTILGKEIVISRKNFPDSIFGLVS